MKCRKIAIAIVAGGLAVLVIVVITAVVVAAVTSKDANDTTTDIRETQTENSPLLTAINRSIEILEDCTTPEGRCYQEAEARAAEQVGAIIAAGNARQWCVDQQLPESYTLDQLARCVSKELDRSTP